MARIYFDYNATTRIDPRVSAAWQGAWTRLPLNPSSPHSAGRFARSRLLSARVKIARSLGVQPDQVLFTSGGSEALNLALRGSLMGKRGHFITSLAEHACVIKTLQSLESRDLEITYLAPERNGAITPEQLERAWRPQTIGAAIMLANNETGAITDWAGVSAWARRRGVFLICDAVCAFGKIPICWGPETRALGIAGHKFHGPPGIGALILERGRPLGAQITGGPQEWGLRAGTENVPAICALAEAIAIAQGELQQNALRVGELADSFWKGLQRLAGPVELNVSGLRLSGTLSVHFPGVEGEALLQVLDSEGVCASYGAACSSGALEPSRVLMAMGHSRERAACSLRFSLGKFNSKRDVERGVRIIARARNKLLC